MFPFKNGHPVSYICHKTAEFRSIFSGFDPKLYKGHFFLYWYSDSFSKNGVFWFIHSILFKRLGDAFKKHNRLDSFHLWIVFAFFFGGLLWTAGAILLQCTYTGQSYNKRFVSTVADFVRHLFVHCYIILILVCFISKLL